MPLYGAGVGPKTSLAFEEPKEGGERGAGWCLG
jgi:hypothetical protein